ncbi:MAG: hypothetical protein II840_01490, partial [Kiritimatiellae bacterium]|nr:hypothetical protein [Kiritimatiellia bacterium]
MTEAELILQKALVGSNLDSSQWNQIQAGFRNRAFFSSRVAEVNILAAMRERVAKYAEGETDLSKIRMIIRDDLRRANYAPEPGQENTIHDLFSQARLDVIIKTNVAQARGYMQYIEDTSPGAFAAFPAQEFTRIRHSNKPRKDWPQRWAKAGGKVYGGKMIALKDDPVWERLSVFGNPFPPFDWGSGMGVMDVDRKTAIQLGLVSDEELRGKTAALREKPVPDFNANLQATVPVPNLRHDSLCGQVLIKNFGDQVAIENSVVSWQGNLIQDVIAGRRKKAQLGVGYNGRPLPLSHNFFREHLSKHFGDNETNPQSIPLTTGDYELLPAVWRKPDRVTKSRD